MSEPTSAYQEPAAEPPLERGNRAAQTRKRQAKTELVGTGVGRAPIPIAHRNVKGGIGSVKFRQHLANWISLNAIEPGLTRIQQAERLGIGVGYLYEIIRTAVKQGLIKFDDPLDKLRYKVIPTAVDNLQELLDRKDKTATLETVKGTVFKQFVTAEGADPAIQNAIALKIDIVPSENPNVVSAQVVGAGRTIQAFNGSAE